MATLEKLCLLITVTTTIFVILPPITAAPVVPDCPYPSFPEALCTATQNVQDQLWCSAGVTLRVKICETLLAPSEGHNRYDSLMKDFSPNVSDTARESVITGFCHNVTLVHQFLTLTLTSSLDSSPDLVQSDKCKEMCTKSKVCGLTLLSFKFYQDLLGSKSSPNESSADQQKKSIDPVSNPVKNDENKSAPQGQGDRDTNVGSHDKNLSSSTRPTSSISPVPVVEEDEIPVPDKISEETLLVSNITTPVDKKIDPIEPPRSDEMNALVKELSEKKAQGQIESKGSTSSSSPQPEVAPIPVVVNENSSTRLKSSSSTSTVATVAKKDDDHPEPAAIPPSITKPEAAGQGQSSSKPDVPPVGKMSPNDEPLPPEGDTDIAYKEDKVDMDSLAPPEDPGIEEDDKNGGGLEKQKGDVILPVPPAGDAKIPKSPIDSNEVDQKPVISNVHRYSQIPDHGDPYLTELNEESGYFNYFITLLGFLFIGFILFHNKKRLIAFLIEGRRPAGHGRRRRISGGGNSSSYRKLENNFE